MWISRYLYDIHKCPQNVPRLKPVKTEWINRYRCRDCKMLVKFCRSWWDYCANFKTNHITFLVLLIPYPQESIFFTFCTYTVLDPWKLALFWLVLQNAGPHFLKNKLNKSWWNYGTYAVRLLGKYASWWYKVS